MMARAQSVGWPTVHAPGKVVLAGEWGVLAGGDALVMAVDRYATVHGTKARADDDWERRCFEIARECAGLDDGPEGLPLVDTTALRAGDAPLGLGSSAAFVVALTGSAFCAAGHDLENPDTREEILATALRAHRLRGGGSGVDVAAAVFGGILRYRVPPGDAPQIQQRTLAPNVTPFVVRGTDAVSTADALRIGIDDELLAEAAQVGGALCDALESDADIVPRVRDADEVLGRIASLTGTSDRAALELARTIAENFGGAAKPSGAGGGDLVLVYAPGVEVAQRERVAHALEDAGLEVLALRTAAQGLSRMEASL